jgi:hypothetical protein
MKKYLNVYGGLLLLCEWTVARRVRKRMFELGCEACMVV